MKTRKTMEGEKKVGSWENGDQTMVLIFTTIDE
jgi:hypothetical protein